MEYGIQKTYKCDNVPRFITKKLMEVYDQSGNSENRYKPSKETRLKHRYYNQSCVITVMHILLLKELLYYC